jgi:hypothetical protein
MTLQRLILTQDSSESERRSIEVDVGCTEVADAKLVRMIERRSRQGEVDPDEHKEQAAKLMDVQPEGSACRTFT